MTLREDIRKGRQEIADSLNQGGVSQGRQATSVHGEDRDVAPPGRPRRESGASSREGVVGVRGKKGSEDFRIKQGDTVYKVKVDQSEAPERSRSAGTIASVQRECVINVYIDCVLFNTLSGNLSDIGVRITLSSGEDIDVLYDDLDIAEDLNSATCSVTLRLPQSSFWVDLIGVPEAGNVPAFVCASPVNLSFDASSYPIEPPEAYTEDVELYYEPMHTITINPLDENDDAVNGAPWILNHHGDPLIQPLGFGPNTLSAKHIHSPFTLTWGSVDGYDDPEPIAETWDPASSGSTHSFDAIYNLLSGSIQVVPTDNYSTVLPDATWTLHSTNVSPSFSYAGMGDETVSPCPVGAYAVDFDAIDGYSTPGPASFSLADDDIEYINGRYEPQIESTITISRTGPSTFVHPMTLNPPYGANIEISGTQYSLTNGTQGEYVVSSEDEAGWSSPANQSLTLDEDNTNLVFTLNYEEIVEDSTILGVATMYNPFNYPEDIAATSDRELTCDIIEQGAGRSWKTGEKGTHTGVPPFEYKDTSPVFGNNYKVAWTVGDADGVPFDYTATPTGSGWSNADSAFLISGMEDEWVGRFARRTIVEEATNYQIESPIRFWDRRYCAKIQLHSDSLDLWSSVTFRLKKVFSNGDSDEYVTEQINMPENGPYWIQVDRSPQATQTVEYTMMIEWGDVAGHSTPTDQAILSDSKSWAEYSNYENSPTEEAGVYEGYYAPAAGGEDVTWGVAIDFNYPTECIFEPGGQRDVVAQIKFPDDSVDVYRFSYSEYNSLWGQYSLPAGCSVRVLSWPDIVNYESPNETNFGEEITVQGVSYLYGKYRHDDTCTFHVSTTLYTAPIEATWLLKNPSGDIMAAGSGAEVFDTGLGDLALFDYPYTIEFLNLGDYAAPSTQTISYPSGYSRDHYIEGRYTNPSQPMGFLTVSVEQRQDNGIGWGSSSANDSPITVLGPDGYELNHTGQLYQELVPVGEYSVIAEDGRYVTAGQTTYRSITPGVAPGSVSAPEGAELEVLYKPIDQAISNPNRRFVKFTWTADESSGGNNSFWYINTSNNYSARSNVDRVIEYFPMNALTNYYSIFVTGPIEIYGMYPNMEVACSVKCGSDEDPSDHEWVNSTLERASNLAHLFYTLGSGINLDGNKWISEISVEITYGI